MPGTDTVVPAPFIENSKPVLEPVIEPKDSLTENATPLEKSRIEIKHNKSENPPINPTDLGSKNSLNGKISIPYHEVATAPSGSVFADRYILNGPPRSGAMSVIRKAEDNLSNELVAIKILKDKKLWTKEMKMLKVNIIIILAYLKLGVVLMDRIK